MTAHERAFQVPGDARATQDAVSDPGTSAWVTANAGSGKTFVLTRRVLRLLLDGAAPETILCLTYTKAAAAEMRHRVGAQLADWAVADALALGRKLEEAIGRAATPAETARARTLFAHALETPGGLKIQTIHAFCEAVLQRFPYEAGVPVDFSVIEEAERVELLRSARERVLAEGLRGNPALRDAVGLLFTRLSDHQIEAALNGALEGGRKLDPVLSDPGRAMIGLRRFLGLGPDDTLEALERDILGKALVPPARYPDILAICPARADGTRFEDKIARLDIDAPDPAAVLKAYLTASQAVPSGFPKAAFAKADPDLADALFSEARRLEALCDRMRAARIAEQSGALLTVIGAVVARFEADKRARSLLDFDDLIARTNALLANSGMRDWVRYKLDAGIGHILVDESQDTNRAQWDVIESLADDFFSGEGAAGRPRTIFAVGDPKQSIYSFQGAEPELFLARGRDYKRRALASGAQFQDRPLRTSFRTLPGILEGVDRLANRADIAPALLADAEGVRHESARTGTGGTIEIWHALEEPKAKPAAEGWPLGPQDNPLGNAERRVAQAIVSRIQKWTATPTPLAGRGRAIRPEDILILVRSRNQIFAEVVAQLRKAGIASPGADKLPVSTHIVVDDLLGLADLLATPEDDLLLAAILRSPLFDLDEDELFALAAPRDRGVSLWSALARSENERARAAHARLDGLRGTLERDRPYSFFAHVLYAQGGLKAFHKRLGAEVDEVIAEFLDLALEHENSDQPSLTGFIARMRASEITVKRDLVERSSGVRVMTVHGAKGLEAPIVILADAAGTPPAIKQKVYFADHDGSPFLLYCAGKELHTARSRILREAAGAAQQAEYWRNLYVAMTRAEDMVIVAGKTHGTNAESWHTAISGALGADAAEIGEADGGARLFDPQPTAPAPIRETGDEATAIERIEPHPIARRKAPRVITPSRHDEERAAPFDTAGEALHDARTARLRGVAVHALLERLGGVSRAIRSEVALTGANALLPERPDLAGPLATEALAILDDPRFEEIFGPRSRAEVAFSLKGTDETGEIVLSGRFDRIVVTETRVRVIDFKSDAKPPAAPDRVTPAYLSQLGLYRMAAMRLFPGREVETAIVWTATGAIMAFPADMLESAGVAVTLE